MASRNGSAGGRVRRLRAEPNDEHEPERYDDMELDYSPLLLSCLERYLPSPLLASSRDSKALFMKDVLSRYFPSDGELTRAEKHREYRQRIISSYQPLHNALYTMSPSDFFLPSFLRATIINGNAEQSIRSILVEPKPGVYAFDMLRPSFCEMLISEVENFEKWAHGTRFLYMRPNTMNKYGAVLDDFGLENMLTKLVNDYISPMAKVLFSEVGGLTLDSHHGFVVEYGTDRDVELGFHVDDSEVTLNVCLGNQFSGGELFFRGVRCDKHLSSETQPEEVLDYSHVPGRAVLHCGRHRHGARATTSGRRVNLLLWCRSSVFRELKKYKKDCSSWCGECRRDKKERQRVSVDATKLELLKRDGISAS